MRTGDNGRLSFAIGTAPGWKDAYSAQLMSTGTCTHIAGTYGGTTVRGYINGIERGTATGGGDMPASTMDVMIGRSQCDNTRRFDGVIDDVRIFSEALSPTRIQALAAGGAMQGAQISVAGDFTRNGGAFSPGFTTVAFTGASQQNGSGPMMFNNFSITNSAGAKIWGDTSINGQL